MVAPRLLAGFRRGEVEAVLGDRGYDSDAIAALVRRLRARVVTAPLGCRRRLRRYSRRLYRQRNVAERFFARIEECRRVATRYDKLDVCYLGFVQLASIVTVLRHP